MEEAKTGAGESGMSLEAEADRSVVRAWGEIDLTVRRDATQLCAEVVERGLPLVIDTRDVTFIDSTGMSILVRLARDAESNGYPVELHNPPWMLRELLTITGVDRILPIADGESSAGPASAAGDGQG
ncbi:STAS domain-containing protein [Actinotalea subterranea]|uniref:STAS domain-containing protein n=1 Tax=Actinotalea subterranea TaxID=2607497 RepID=UPI00165DB0F5|nr:STAS domain-containing protein [Actinotalea subterranea]